MKVRWPFFVLSLLALTTAPTESVEPSAIVIASTLGSEVQPGKYISTVPLDILFSQANLAYQLKEYEQSQKLVEYKFSEDDEKKLKSPKIRLAGKKEVSVSVPEDEESTAEEQESAPVSEERESIKV